MEKDNHSDRPGDLISIEEITIPNQFGGPNNIPHDDINPLLGFISNHFETGSPSGRAPSITQNETSPDQILVGDSQMEVAFEVDRNRVQVVADQEAAQVVIDDLNILKQPWADVVEEDDNLEKENAQPDEGSDFEIVRTKSQKKKQKQRQKKKAVTPITTRSREGSQSLAQ